MVPGRDAIIASIVLTLRYDFIVALLHTNGPTNDFNCWNGRQLEAGIVCFPVVFRHQQFDRFCF